MQFILTVFTLMSFVNGQSVTNVEYPAVAMRNVLPSGQINVGQLDNSNNQFGLLNKNQHGSLHLSLREPVTSGEPTFQTTNGNVFKINSQNDANSGLQFFSSYSPSSFGGKVTQNSYNNPYFHSNGIGIEPPELVFGTTNFQNNPKLISSSPGEGINVHNYDNPYMSIDGLIKPTVPLDVKVDFSKSGSQNSGKMLPTFPDGSIKSHVYDNTYKDDFKNTLENGWFYKSKDKNYQVQMAVDKLAAHNEMKTDINDEGYIVGHYQYTDPAGLLHDVTYTADKNGFRQKDNIIREKQLRPRINPTPFVNKQEIIPRKIV